MVLFLHKNKSVVLILEKNNKRFKESLFAVPNIYINKVKGATDKCTTYNAEYSKRFYKNYQLAEKFNM